MNFHAATTRELVDYYNANSGRTPVKKFADRKTAERRCAELVVIDAAETPITAELVLETSSVYGFSVHGLTECPHCEAHLSNGVGEHLQEVNGTKIKHDEFQFACLACGAEFGPSIKRSARKENSASVTRPAMQASLGLDRNIMCVETKESWKNAFRMWKQNPSWMTSAQVDRLTRVLYTAAKQPTPVSATVAINGRTFKLVNV